MEVAHVESIRAAGKWTCRLPIADIRYVDRVEVAWLAADWLWTFHLPIDATGLNLGDRAIRDVLVVGLLRVPLVELVRSLLCSR